jgi:hypothetical protein
LADFDQTSNSIELFLQVSSSSGSQEFSSFLWNLKVHYSDKTPLLSPFLNRMNVVQNLTPPTRSSSSSFICHGVGPLVDSFRSHVSRSLFKGLPRFLLPVGEQCFIILGSIVLSTPKRPKSTPPFRAKVHIPTTVYDCHLFQPCLVFTLPRGTARSRCAKTIETQRK